MEDLFNVAVRSRGLDGQGHLGYAAQPGLAPFGPDVFNNTLGRLDRARRSLEVGGIVHASAAHPRLAIEGDTVSVALEHGRGLATAVGPAVPSPRPLAVPASTPCTFTITLKATSGTVPLSGAALTIVDEQGLVHHPLVSRADGPTLPSRVTPGRPVVLTVKDVLPVGGGRIMWTPSGSAPVVSWDFDVEVD